MHSVTQKHTHTQNTCAHALNASKRSSTLAFPAAPGTLLLACVCGGLHAGSMALNARSPPALLTARSLLSPEKKPRDKKEAAVSASASSTSSPCPFFFSSPAQVVGLAHSLARSLIPQSGMNGVAGTDAREGDGREREKRRRRRG